MAQHGTYFDPQCGLVFHNYLDNRAKYDGIGNYNAVGSPRWRRRCHGGECHSHGVTAKGLKLVFGTDAVAGAHGRNAEEFDLPRQGRWSGRDVRYRLRDVPERRSDRARQ